MFARLLIVIILSGLFGPALAQSEGNDQIEAALAAADDGGVTRQFYKFRDGTLAWNGSPEARSNARLAKEILSNAAAQGLDRERYSVLLKGDNSAVDDVALSAALLDYMHDLSVGRDDLRSLDADMALQRPFFDAAAKLDGALRQNRLSAMLAALEPSSDAYAVLKAALARNPTGSDASTIIANMERWRWMPRSLEPDRIVINAADASLQMWLGGIQVLTSRVIVGRKSSPTPILRAEGAGITINPPWTVPQSIAAKEILPQLKRNHAYLASQDMILLNGPPDDPQGLNINWRAIRPGTFPYRIQQRPGPHNSLGQIKLELPNRFEVYLHDTPGKALFSSPVRTLSHGCVRVEQILPLASYALNADLGAMGKIRQAISSGETRFVPLHKRLPVYFLYWTAYPDTDGKLQFRPDVYGRDQRLIAAMQIHKTSFAANSVVCLKG